MVKSPCFACQRARQFKEIRVPLIHIHRSIFVVAVSLSLGAALPVFAQTALPPAPGAVSKGNLSAASLIREALDIAGRTKRARPVVVHGAAALLPSLTGADRDALTARWLGYATAPSLPRDARSNALASFFDVAARADTDFAEKIALRTPDAAARSGALLQISRAVGNMQVLNMNWRRADDLLGRALVAARQEPAALPRARALVFGAYRASELNPARVESALGEAQGQVDALPNGREKDYLLLELSGAAAQFNLTGARNLAARIGDGDLKTLAGARIGLSEISQTSLREATSDRVRALATAAAPYDSRALPTLLRLPAQPDVVKAVSQTLPPIYPSARPAIDISQLETLWDYSQKAPAGVYRDQLQSRLARLMVLQDLWRGRDWGKQLAWKGGRVQVGAFLKQVLEARQSSLRAGALQDVAKTDADAAYAQAEKLPAPARAEALLLLAGQVLG